VPDTVSPPSAAGGGPARRSIGGRAPAAALAAGLIAALAGPAVLDKYAETILTQAFAFAAVAVTVDVLWGYTGILSWGQSAFFGIGAYSVGLFFSHVDDGPLASAEAVILAVAGAAALGGLVAWLSFAGRVTGFYVAVVTLALPVAIVQLILSGGTFTGSSSGLSGYPTPDLDLGQWYQVTALFLLAVLAAAFVVVRSDVGRILIAIRESEERCRYLGINTPALKIVLFAACGAVAALAGTLYAASADVVATQLADFVLGTQMVIWVALGGRGTLIGGVAGAIAINAISAVLGGNLPYLWLLIIGLVFVIVVVYMPQGFLPALAGLTRRLAGGTKAGPRPAGGEGRLTESGPGSPPARPDRGGQAEEAILRLRGLGKRFGSLQVLSGIDLTVRRGELVSVIGPNGAGKTTLMRCLSDGRERSAGEVTLGGRELGRRPPHRCVSLGVGHKFQTPVVFEGLTVRDCLRVARAFRSRPSLWRRSRDLELPFASLYTVRTTGLDRLLDVPARDLAHGLKQALELAMVLALEPAVLLLDEPTAGLTRDERSAIGEVLRELARRHDIAVLLVEHDLDFVRTISSRIVVLHQGRILLDGPVEEVVGSEVVRTVYVGSAP
jgi:branched-chain amino acid transport system permease protein